MRPCGCWGRCPRGEGPLWPPTHAVGHPSPGAWPALPEGALGPRPSPWGPLPESLPSLMHVPPLKSSLRSLASLCSWVVPAPLTAHLEGLPPGRVPPWRHRAEALSPTSSSSRCCSPGPLRAPAGRPCCPPASVPDPIEDRAGQETHLGGAAARLGGRVPGEGEGGQVWAPGCLSACRSPVLPQTAGVR